MRLLLFATLLVSLCAHPLSAQELGGSSFQLKNTLQKMEGAKVDISAILVPTSEPGVVQLQVKMVLPPGSNSYSQDPSFPKPTKITLEESGWKPIDPSFAINPPPKKEHDENFDKVVEKLKGTVIFSRRYAVPTGMPVTALSVKGEISYLFCDHEQCRPQSAKFTATVSAPRKEDAAAPGDDVSAVQKQTTPAPATPAMPEKAAPSSLPGVPESEAALSGLAPSESQRFGYLVEPHRSKSAGKSGDDPAKVQFELSPANAKPGETVTLAITMLLADRWNTYGLEKADPNQVEMPTTIQFEPQNLQVAGALVSVPQPMIHVSRLQGGDQRSNMHQHRVTWKQSFQVVDNAPYGVSGSIRYQVCETDKSCLPPKTVNFALGSAQQVAIEGALPLAQSFVDAPPESSFEIDSKAQEVSLWGHLWTAFLGGFLMNIMPCVLPVLAIKILSFVQQAGEKRSRILGLNLAYTLGVMSVFLVFAFLSVILGQSMAAVFQSTSFMIVMACVVFVMGLSLFGVFEFPVPGIIPSAAHHQEGYLGAISTGIVATILGTPCLAPLVAPVFVWGLAQPPSVVFGMFAVMGLGMASPFLLTGFFPSLVKWLPRPGNWMVKFKQFTGFVMMGTTIWVMFSIPMEWRIPVLVLLLGLALFVWLCANLTSPADSFSKRLIGCVVGAVICLPIFGYGAYMMIDFTPSNLGGAVVASASPEGEKDHSKMPWQPFTEEQLLKLRTEGKPMLIDFTANWCVNCKINEKVALDRVETVEFVKSNGFVPLLADFTYENPEILKYLRKFGQDSVPLTIIIPPGKESKIIALRGLFTRDALLERLREAVNSPTGDKALINPTMGSIGVQTQ